jgi:pimeloyl-ACP methyl ester carboxylesterase
MSAPNRHTAIRTGLLRGRLPFISGGAGPRHAVVLFGANALFKPLDRVAKPARYARQVQKLLPSGWRLTIIGYEEVPPEATTLDTIADDVALAIEELSPEPIALVGISLGGLVAQRMAARHPERVDRLILLVSAHRFSKPGWQRLMGQFDALRAGDFAALLRDNALLFRRPWFNALIRMKLWKDRGRLHAEFKDPELILRAYQGVFSPDFARNAEVARQIAAPTLVIGGGADQYFDAACLRETAELIPGANLRLFERETHMLPIERSAAVAHEIAVFLDGGAD